jgi:hypothetical protein
VDGQGRGDALPDCRRASSPRDLGPRELRTSAGVEWPRRAGRSASLEALGALTVSFLTTRIGAMRLRFVVALFNRKPWIRTLRRRVRRRRFLLVVDHPGNGLDCQQGRRNTESPVEVGQLSVCSCWYERWPDLVEWERERFKGARVAVGRQCGSAGPRLPGRRERGRVPRFHSVIHRRWVGPPAEAAF